MRQAPPLVVVVLPDRRAAWAVAACVTLAAGGLALRFLPWALLGLPLVAWLGFRLARPAERRLRFDGQQWWLLAPGWRDEVQVNLRIAIDLDGWLLLQATAATSRWIRYYFPLNRAGQGSIWGQLRATLISAPTRPHG
ncbi:hypothetical protein [Roseateles paludis]|uniref:Toxin CptA n=1 Tax=Roseateles paludis TaxID=3145238 RepID=A0ABV0G6I9_9BURK